MLATTAADYFDAYKLALDTGTLTQGAFHIESDGRQLACALGVVGPEVNGPKDCPATIMPRWLAQMVPAFFDGQRKGDAFAWGLAFAEALKRLDGKVPFSVIHDWHANAVCQLGIDAAIRRNRDPDPHEALKALHLRALAGEQITADEWRPVLKNACADACADASADAYAYANADAYAYAYANAYAYASASAYASAYANAKAWKLLAEGMVAALNRAPIVSAA